MKYLLPTDVFLQLMNQALDQPSELDSSAYCRKNYRSFQPLVRAESTSQRKVKNEAGARTALPVNWHRRHAIR